MEQANVELVTKKPVWSQSSKMAQVEADGANHNSLDDELTFPVAPARIFKASIVDSKNLIPKLLPHAIKSIELLKGDGGAGSIKQINFVEGSKIRYLKHQIDDLNEENYVYNYTLIEGEGMMDKIDKISYEQRPDGDVVECVLSHLQPAFDHPYSKGRSHWSHLRGQNIMNE
ncbi:major allergen Mal d 1-like [Apium graveolens]|uniref:major allergen Mal d 1-like n=1 Tax=Apium graveolens TaxID=4045 RepID=UPI003D79B170